MKLAKRKKTNKFLKRHLDENDCCPFCGGSDPEGKEVTIEGQVAKQDCWCSDCHREWQDQYILARIIEYDVKCKFCEKSTASRSAHLHQDEWVCESCWDERLRSSE